MSWTTMEDKRFTKHGFPKGFRFVPTHLELITILSHRVQDRRLHPKVAGIFHELSILEHHPEELHDMYERDKEHRYIYFFSWRQYQKTGGAAGGGPVHKKRQRGAAGQDEDDSEPRPVRLAKGGGWKPSGGGHVLRWPKEKGGFVAGKMVTMVFYDHRDGGQVKSQWGMHEFTVPVDQRQLSKPAKTRRSHELALYRLYKLKSDDMESDDGAGSNQTLANVSAADGYFSAPCSVGQPSFGIFTGRNQPLAAGASTSRMLPPQLQQHHIPNVGHPQYYHHHQYAFGAAPASAAHQRVRTMTMPPAYGTGMPDPQLFPFARPPGTGLPGRQSLQFARSPAPSQMPVPPAAANKASHQAPAKATYGGAGQQAGHSGATRSLPSAPVSTPPPAAESPSAEDLSPMTATHGGAGQQAGHSGATRSLPSAPVSTPPPAAESPSAEDLSPMTATHGGAGQQAGHSGATRSLPSAPVSTPPLAAESPSAEDLSPMTATHGGAGQEASGNFGASRSSQDATATATAETGQQVQFADCVKPEEERMPPPIEDSIPADSNDGIGMPEWDLDLGWMSDDRFLFTMDELCRCAQRWTNHRRRSRETTIKAE